MRLISQCQLVTTISYSRSFSYIGADGKETGAGCAFPCDKDGNVDLAALHPCGRANYMSALTGIHHYMAGVRYYTNPQDGYDPTYIPFYCTGRWEVQTVRDDGVVESRHDYRQPAVGECACGEHVTLGGFTNTCECGRDYSMSGQMLAHRSQWGEETGESLSDILSILDPVSDHMHR